jgi:signal transduction histidine kinase
VYSVALDHETKERLIEAARLAAVGRLMRPVAHELSTPLAAIALRAESLERSADDAEAGSTQAREKQRRYLKALTEESQRCRDLLSTVREFAGGAESATTTVDLVALCRGAVRLVSHEAMRRQIQIGIDGQAMSLVRGQHHRLAQAVLALVLNAVDASPQGGKVAVEVRAGVDEVSVVVEDEGEGIPEAIRERLFQPFVSTRGASQGLGLGLMACQTIAEMHGGSIDWRPRPTRGTRFVFRLPSGPAASAAGEPRVDA